MDEINIQQEVGVEVVRAPQPEITVVDTLNLTDNLETEDE